MARRRERGLSPEDRTLWEKVAARTQPLHKSQRQLAPIPVEKPAAPKPATDAQKMPAFRVGARAKKTETAIHDLAPSLQERLAQGSQKIDRRTQGRLKRGKLNPESRLDLHGMTQDRAHPALTRFILDAHARGQKLVLVITGKGKMRDGSGPMPNPVGVLRHNVPHWLSSGPLKQIVLQTSQAHLRHGGEGAYYVWLRRAR